jgi:hypothetical protein
MADYFFSDGRASVALADAINEAVIDLKTTSRLRAQLPLPPAIGPQKVRKRIAMSRSCPTEPASAEVLLAQVSTPFQPSPIAAVGSRHAVECFPWYY